MEGNTSDINKEEFETLMEELEKRYEGIEIEPNQSVDDILAMFDDNGNWIHAANDYDDFEIIMKELEEKYGQCDECGDSRT